jgi:hypothetical protein
MLYPLIDFFNRLPHGVLVEKRACIFFRNIKKIKTSHDGKFKEQINIDITLSTNFLNQIIPYIYKCIIYN